MKYMKKKGFYQKKYITGCGQCVFYSRGFLSEPDECSVYYEHKDDSKWFVKKNDIPDWCPIINNKNIKIKYCEKCDDYYLFKCYTCETINAKNI